MSKSTRSILKYLVGAVERLESHFPNKRRAKKGVDIEEEEQYFDRGGTVNYEDGWNEYGQDMELDKEAKEGDFGEGFHAETGPEKEPEKEPENESEREFDVVGQRTATPVPKPKRLKMPSRAKSSPYTVVRN